MFMKLVIPALFLGFIQAYADRNDDPSEVGLAEQTYLDSLNLAGENLDVDLDSATNTPISEYDKKADLVLSPKNSLKLKKDRRLEEADKYLEMKDIPKEDPAVVSARIEKIKREKSLKDFMAHNEM